MKKRTSLVAILLIISLLCSSCSDLFGNKLKPKRILKLYRNSDYALIEIDDIVDALEDFNHSRSIDNDVEDGAYAVTTSTKEIKRVFRDYDRANLISMFFEYDKHMQEVCWFIRLENDFTSAMYLSAVAIQFDSKESAIEYLEEMTDKNSDSNGNSRSTSDFDSIYNFDSGEDGNLRYFLGNARDIESGIYDMNVFLGLYQEGRYVVLIFGADLNSSKCEREIEDLCELIELESPTEI